MAYSRKQVLGIQQQASILGRPTLHSKEGLIPFPKRVHPLSHRESTALHPIDGLPSREDLLYIAAHELSKGQGLLVWG